MIIDKDFYVLKNERLTVVQLGKKVAKIDEGFVLFQYIPFKKYSCTERTKRKMASPIINKEKGREKN